MSTPRLKAMLVIPNFSVARDVGKMLNDQSAAFDIAPVDSLSAAQKRSTEERFDVVLLSLSVLDGKFGGLSEIKASIPDAPILVLISRADQAEAVQAIRHGADDCIVLDDVSGNGLRQTIFNAIHRKQLLKDISASGCEDSVTGLCNLDGFKSMAQRLFDTCRQPRSKVYIVTFRVQGTSQTALTSIAEALRGTCRRSEIMPSPSVSRVGVEEFALLASADSLADVQHLLNRCEETFRRFTANESALAPSSVQFGMAAYDPEYPASPTVVLERARQNWKAILPPQSETSSLPA
jgi:PleD family two-component response regulator